MPRTKREKRPIERIRKPMPPPTKVKPNKKAEADKRRGRERITEEEVQ